MRSSIAGVDGQRARSTTSLGRAAGVVLAGLVFAAVLAASPRAAATPTTTVYRTDLTGYSQQFNPCTNEYMRWEGQVIGINHFTSNGQTAQVHSRISLQGVSATGLTSGTEYRLVESLMNAGTRAIDGYPFELSQGATLLMVSKGGAENFVNHVTFHYTYNANGDLTAFAVDLRAECVG